MSLTGATLQQLPAKAQAVEGWVTEVNKFEPAQIQQPKQHAVKIPSKGGKVQGGRPPPLKSLSGPSRDVTEQHAPRHTQQQYQRSTSQPPLGSKSQPSRSQPTPRYESTTHGGKQPTPRTESRRGQPTPHYESTSQQPTPRLESGRGQPTPRREGYKQLPTSHLQGRGQPSPRHGESNTQPTPRYESTQYGGKGQRPEGRGQPTPRYESSSQQPSPRRESVRGQPTPRYESTSQPPTRRIEGRGQPTPRYESTSQQPTPRQESGKGQPSPRRQEHRGQTTPQYEGTGQPTPRSGRGQSTQRQSINSRSISAGGGGRGGNRQQGQPGLLVTPVRESPQPVPGPSRSYSSPPPRQAPPTPQQSPSQLIKAVSSKQSPLPTPQSTQPAASKGLKGNSKESAKGKSKGASKGSKNPSLPAFTPRSEYPAFTPRSELPPALEPQRSQTDKGKGSKGQSGGKGAKGPVEAGPSASFGRFSANDDGEQLPDNFDVMSASRKSVFGKASLTEAQRDRRKTIPVANALSQKEPSSSSLSKRLSKKPSDIVAPCSPIGTFVKSELPDTDSDEYLDRGNSVLHPPQLKKANQLYIGSFRGAPMTPSMKRIQDQEFKLRQQQLEADEQAKKNEELKKKLEEAELKIKEEHVTLREAQKKVRRQMLERLQQQERDLMEEEELFCQTQLKAKADTIARNKRRRALFLHGREAEERILMEDAEQLTTSYNLLIEREQRKKEELLKRQQALKEQEERDLKEREEQQAADLKAKEEKELLKKEQKAAKDAAEQKEQADREAQEKKEKAEKEAKQAADQKAKEEREAKAQKEQKEQQEQEAKKVSKKEKAVKAQEEENSTSEPKNDKKDKKKKKKEKKQDTSDSEDEEEPDKKKKKKKKKPANPSTDEEEEDEKQQKSSKKKKSSKQKASSSSSDTPDEESEPTKKSKKTKQKKQPSETDASTVADQPTKKSKKNKDVKSSSKKKKKKKQPKTPKEETDDTSTESATPKSSKKKQKRETKRPAPLKKLAKALKKKQNDEDEDTPSSSEDDNGTPATTATPATTTKVQKSKKPGKKKKQKSTRLEEARLLELERALEDEREMLRQKEQDLLQLEKTNKRQEKERQIREATTRLRKERLALEDQEKKLRRKGPRSKQSSSFRSPSLFLSEDDLAVISLGSTKASGYASSVRSPSQSRLPAPMEVTSPGHILTKGIALPLKAKSNTKHRDVNTTSIPTESYDAATLWNRFDSMGRHPTNLSYTEMVKYTSTLGFSKVESLCITAMWCNTIDGCKSSIVGTGNSNDVDKTATMDANASIMNGSQFVNSYPIGDGASYSDVPIGSPQFEQIASEVASTCDGLPPNTHLNVVRIVEAHCNDEVTSKYLKIRSKSLSKTLYYNPIEMRTFLDIVLTGLTSDLFYSTRAHAKIKPGATNTLCFLLCEAALGKCKSVAIPEKVSSSDSRSVLGKVLKQHQNIDTVCGNFEVTSAKGTSVHKQYASRLGALPRYLVHAEVQLVESLRKAIEVTVPGCSDFENLQGVYKESGTYRDAPYFSKDDVRLFTHGRGGWMFAESEEQMSIEEGIAASGSDYGKPPHEVRKWLVSDGKTWIEQKIVIRQLKSAPTPPVKPPNSANGGREHHETSNITVANNLMDQTGEGKPFVYGTPIAGYGLWKWTLRITHCSGEVGFGVGFGDWLRTELTAPVTVTIRLSSTKTRLVLSIYKIGNKHTTKQMQITCWSPTELIFPQVLFLGSGSVYMAEHPQFIQQLD